MRFRQVHLDFHTSEDIENVGGEFSKEQFQSALKTGHVDSMPPRMGVSSFFRKRNASESSF